MKTEQMGEMRYNTGVVNRKYVCRSGAVNTLRHVTRKDKFLMLPHTTTPTRICPKCLEEKPATSAYFSQRKDTPSGLFRTCKVCRQEAQNKYRAANKETIDARNRASYANKSLAQKRHAKYLANKEKVAEQSRLWYAANKDRAAANGGRWKAANKAYIAEQRRAGYAANRDRYVAQTERRRARKQDAEGIYTAADVATQYQRQKGKCHWCGENLRNKYEVDHIVPLTRGGSNWPENLVVACKSCNASKGAKLPHEWPRGNRLL